MHICVGVKAGVCLWVRYLCAWISVCVFMNRRHLSLCQEFFCAGIDSVCCWKRCAGVSTLKAQN